MSTPESRAHGIHATYCDCGGYGVHDTQLAKAQAERDRLEAVALEQQERLKRLERKNETLGTTNSLLNRRIQASDRRCREALDYLAEYVARDDRASTEKYAMLRSLQAKIAAAAPAGDP